MKNTAAAEGFSVNRSEMPAASGHSRPFLVRRHMQGNAPSSSPLGILTPSVFSIAAPLFPALASHVCYSSLLRRFAACHVSSHPLHTPISDLVAERPLALYETILKFLPHPPLNFQKLILCLWRRLQYPTLCYCESSKEISHLIHSYCRTESPSAANW